MMMTVVVFDIKRICKCATRWIKRVASQKICDLWPFAVSVVNLSIPNFRGCFGEESIQKAAKSVVFYYQFDIVCDDYSTCKKVM